MTSLRCSVSAIRWPVVNRPRCSKLYLNCLVTGLLRGIRLIAWFQQPIAGGVQQNVVGKRLCASRVQRDDVQRCARVLGRGGKQAASLPFADAGRKRIKTHMLYFNGRWRNTLRL